MPNLLATFCFMQAQHVDTCTMLDGVTHGRTGFLGTR